MTATGVDGDGEKTTTRPSNADDMAKELIAEARRRAAEALAGSSGRRREGADANEIQLEDDAVVNKRRVFDGDVGDIPRRARIANDGVLGVYAPLDNVDDDEDDDDDEKVGSRQRLNREYVGRRLERFDRDLRGYDVQTCLIDRSSCEKTERIGVPSSSSIARRPTGRASAAADAAPSGAAGSARAGLGSRPSDAASIDDPYARYRSERSSAYKRERDFGPTRAGASASTAKRT